MSKPANAALIACTLASAVQASTTTGTIAQMAINRQTANMVFVRMNPQPTPAEACASTTAWSYVFPMTTDQDKKLFAMLEGAQLAGRTITIYGTGACADYGSIESGNIVVVN